MKIVTRDDFVDLLRTRGSDRLRQHLPRYDLDMILRGVEYAVHEGDLSPPAGWRRPTDNLLVLGSLLCDSLVDNAPSDDSHWGGSLWVLGDLRCRNFAGHFGAAVIVDGDLRVAELAVAAFEDSLLLVTGDFTAHNFYGDDIWAEVGGRAAMEHGHGYALPLGYDNAEAQVINPRHGRESALALLNLDEEKGVEELVAKLRRGEHLRAKHEG